MQHIPIRKNWKGRDKVIRYADECAYTVGWATVAWTLSSITPVLSGGTVPRGSCPGSGSGDISEGGTSHWVASQYPMMILRGGMAPYYQRLTFWGFRSISNPATDFIRVGVDTATSNYYQMQCGSGGSVTTKTTSWNETSEYNSRMRIAVSPSKVKFEIWPDARWATDVMTDEITTNITTDVMERCIWVQSYIPPPMFVKLDYMDLVAMK